MGTVEWMLLVQVEYTALLTYQFHTRSNCSCRLNGGFHASAAFTHVKCPVAFQVSVWMYWRELSGYFHALTCFIREFRSSQPYKKLAEPDVLRFGRKLCSVVTPYLSNYWYNIVPVHRIPVTGPVWPRGFQEV